MSFNLRNRSLLTVQDFTQREFHYLLDLARDLKRAKYARTEQDSRVCMAMRSAASTHSRSCSLNWLIPDRRIERALREGYGRTNARSSARNRMHRRGLFFTVKNYAWGLGVAA